MIYEFLCPKCKKRYEEFKKMGDYESNCPDCGVKSEKLISKGSFNFANWIPEWKRSIDYATGT